MVESRGCERFGLIAGALPEGAEQRFFAALNESERRTVSCSWSMAEQHCDADAVASRIEALVRMEADIVAALPLLPRLH